MCTAWQAQILDVRLGQERWILNKTRRKVVAELPKEGNLEGLDTLSAAF